MTYLPHGLNPEDHHLWSGLLGSLLQALLARILLFQLSKRSVRPCLGFCLLYERALSWFYPPDRRLARRADARSHLLWYRYRRARRQGMRGFALAWRMLEGQVRLSPVRAAVRVAFRRLQAWLALTTPLLRLRVRALMGMPAPVPEAQLLPDVPQVDAAVATIDDRPVGLAGAQHVQDVAAWQVVQQRTRWRWAAYQAAHTGIHRQIMPPLAAMTMAAPVNRPVMNVRASDSVVLPDLTGGQGI